MKKRAALLLLLLPACVSQPSPADLATYQAIAPEYVRYVQADTALQPDQKTRRLNTVETWRLRVGAPVQ